MTGDVHPILLGHTPPVFILEAVAITWLHKWGLFPVRMLEVILDAGMQRGRRGTGTGVPELS
jgi:hypothetical protein